MSRERKIKERAKREIENLLVKVRAEYNADPTLENRNRLETYEWTLRIITGVRCT